MRRGNVESTKIHSHVTFIHQVKVKVRVNLHGLFTVASASLTEKKETIEEPAETMDTEEKTDKVRRGYYLHFIVGKSSYNFKRERTVVSWRKESIRVQRRGCWGNRINVSFVCVCTWKGSSCWWHQQLPRGCTWEPDPTWGRHATGSKRKCSILLI